MKNSIDRDTVREALERYFEGATSVREERALREYFAGAEDIPTDLAYARTIFGFWDDTAAQTSESTFEVPADTRPIVPARRRRRLMIWACGAAAAVVAAVAVLVTGNTETVYCYVNGQAVTDYDLAYAYTQGALGLIEDNIRKPGEYLVALGPDDPFEGLRYLEMLGKLTEGNDNVVNHVVN